MSRSDNPLVRAVARLPLRVRAKLLLAFAGIAAVLVVVAVLGLRVLGQSNDRVERLRTLQLRAAAYQGLQTQAQQLRQLLGLRAAGDPNANIYVGGNDSTLPSSGTLAFLDQTIATSLSQLGPATNAARLGFEPPPADEAALDRIREGYSRFSEALTQIIAFDESGTPEKGRKFLAEAIAVANDLGAVTNGLATTTQAQTNALVAENRRAFATSQRLFIGVAAGSVVLALGLGLVLAWSLIGPIQRTERRLAAIAAGDFSGHVEVPNRDELGILAANVNRMNDELERLYGELETVSRHKSEFLANMSHELRTPLNAIIGFSEVLREQMFGELNEQQVGYVQDVLEAGQHLLSLINDILDLSKVEAGRMELELGEVWIDQALKSGLTMHGERASRGGITLQITVDPDIGVIQADERKLRQVIFNLLSNAVKLTPSGGRVDVTATMNNGMVEVAVADTGPGIAPEDQERIFEEFQQARGASSRPGGTGLGLTLSRRFIELHGGRLWVESELGVGSTFRFTVPRNQPG